MNHGFHRVIPENGFSPIGRTQGMSFRQPLLSFMAMLTRPIAIIRDYRLSYFSSDLTAGLTVAVVMIPQALAFAQIANLPPEYGLYTAIVASLVGALWGSSIHLQTGPTNTSALLILSVLLSITSPSSPEYLIAAGMLAFLSGLFRFLMGTARLGVLVNFVSDSVIVGFTAGAEFLIIVFQVKHLLKISISENLDPLTAVAILFEKIPHSHIPTLLLGMTLLLILLLLQYLFPRIPASLLIVVIGAVLVKTLPLVETYQVATIGKLSATFPPFTPLPLLDFGLWSRLLNGSIALAAIGLVEATSIARSLSAKSGQKLDSNQEFIGQGMAGMACGFFSGYPCSGSFTRSMINYRSGAKTPLCNVFSSLSILVLLQALAPFAAAIPMAALSVIIIVNALKLTNWTEIARIWKLRKDDRLIMLVTLTATFTLPLHMAVLIGIGLSIAMYLKKTSTPRIREVVPNDSFEVFTPRENRAGCPQMAIIEILGDFYFGAAHYVEEQVMELFQRTDSRKFLLLRMQNVNQCDISGVHALEGILQHCQKRQGELFICRLRRPVFDVLASTGFVMKLGGKNLLQKDKNAIRHLFYRVLDPSICIYGCKERVFRECQNLPKNLLSHHRDWHIEVTPMEIPTLDPRQLYQEMKSAKNTLVVDVREAREYKQGHIPGSKLIPIPLLLSLSPPTDKSDPPMVLICQDQRHSNRVAAILLQRGFQDVKVLRGGFDQWVETNLLIATGTLSRS